MGLPGLIIGGIGAVGNLVGAKMGADAAKSAAKQQQKAAKQAFEYQREERDRMVGLNRPFMEGMDGRMSTLRSLTTPGQSYSPQQQEMRQMLRQPQGPTPMPPPPQRAGLMGKIDNMRGQAAQLRPRADAMQQMFRSGTLGDMRRGAMPPQGMPMPQQQGPPMPPQGMPPNMDPEFLQYLMSRQGQQQR
jgi:hypothetical protein